MHEMAIAQGILDLAVAPRGDDFCIVAACDSVKFHEPVLEAGSGIDLP